MASPLKVGLVGAGYIADWHAAAIDRCPDVQVAAVCDRSASAVDRFRQRYPNVETYTDLADMLGRTASRSIHVLTPPDNHAQTARAVLDSGRHAFVEKPLALSGTDCLSLSAAAQEKDRRIGVNHNFLWTPAYEKLRACARDGTLGPANNIAIEWQLSLPVLRSGPYGLWLSARPENLLHEILPHSLGFAFDLTTDPRICHVEAFSPITLPTGVTLHQGFSILARSGETAITVTVSFIEGMPAMCVRARGTGGIATAHYGNDTFTLEQSNAGDIVIGPLRHEIGQGVQKIGNGLSNAWRQVRSGNALAPFGLSMARSVAGFYAGLSGDIDRRHSVAQAAGISAAIREIAEAAVAKAPRPDVKAASAKRRPGRPAKAPPPVLVFGGTGYIGRHLVARLAEDGHDVRVFSRGSSNQFQAYGDRVRVIRGNLGCEADILAAMEGVDTAFHLARANEKTWDAYREHDVAVSRRIGTCAGQAGVRRLIYTGTIDSYDASGAVPVIDEDTPFGNLDNRNLYARAKAAGESALLEQHRVSGLPLVIARPGIVVGADGPLTHWGVALWRDATACTLWGDGRNSLPFVAIGDCVDGLIRTMATEGIEGQSFNLVGDPLLSARDYLGAISHRAAVRIRYRPKSILSYYLTDLIKYSAKRAIGKSVPASTPSYKDWASRQQKAAFANIRSRQTLQWSPISDRAAFLDAVIDPNRLFGISPA